eukprot:500776-Pyramimonas_sp.AAC.1
MRGGAAGLPAVVLQHAHPMPTLASQFTRCTSRPPATGRGPTGQTAHRAPVSTRLAVLSLELDVSGVVEGVEEATLAHVLGHTRT